MYKRQIIETIGTASSLSAACPFNATGAFKITNYDLGTTTIRSENADCFRAQTSFVRGGNLISENQSCFVMGEISFTKLTLKKDITGNWSKIYKSDITMLEFGVLVPSGSEFTNNTITGVITQSSTYGLVKCNSNSIVQNNYIKALSGSNRAALMVRTNVPPLEDQQNISNNIIINLGTGIGAHVFHGSLHNNYIYSNSSWGVYFANGGEYFQGNTVFTNSSSLPAIESLGDVVCNNTFICLNSSHTGTPLQVGGVGQEVYNNVAICNNASTSNIKLLTSTVKLVNNTMSETGSGLDLNGYTNAQTNSADSKGNIQIG